jgi:hypothetical protein
MKKILLRALPLLLACASLTGVRSAGVDPVIFWNGLAAAEFTASLSGTPPRPGQAGGLDLAMVHTAIHDAVEAYEKKFESYAGEITGAFGSPAAAVAAAAHDVLVNLYSAYPSIVADVNTQYMQYLTGNGLIGDPGILVGQNAAANIINLRQNDGRFAPLPSFTGGTAPGQWRPTESFNLPPGAPAGTPPGPPPSFAPMAVVWLANVVRSR